MANDPFEASLKRGPHRLLARLAGKWQGTAKTWFEPGKLADTQPIRGAIRTVLGGRFVQFNYTSRLLGAKMLGQALIGHDLSRGKYVMAWSDSCHNGTNIMNLLQDREADAKSFCVRGSYPDGKGGPDWGWRIEFRLAGPTRLVVTHYNILPDGQEAKGIEMTLTRAK